MNLSFLTTLTILFFLLTLPSAYPTDDKEGYQVKLGTDWRPYGVYSPKSGFGYNVEAAKIVYTTERSEFTIGTRIAYYPNERAYSWSNGSRTFGYARENRLYYVGIPLSARYHFSEKQFSPFVEMKNSLDVRVREQTEDAEPKTTCFGDSRSGIGSPQTCIDEGDFKEVAKNRLLVWRQAIALGVRVRLGETSILLSEGILWDVTPNREAVFLGPTTRGFYLSTNLGLSF